MTLTIPIRLTSRSNSRRHWSAQYREDKATKVAVLAMLGQHRAAQLPVVVTLTRVAPRALDVGDNLNASMKAVRDACAWWLLGRPRLANGKPAWGRGDDDPRITWRYAQRTGGVREYALVVDIQPGGRDG